VAWRERRWVYNVMGIAMVNFRSGFKYILVRTRHFPKSRLRKGATTNILNIFNEFAHLVPLLVATNATPFTCNTFYMQWRPCRVLRGEGVVRTCGGLRTNLGSIGMYCIMKCVCIILACVGALRAFICNRFWYGRNGPHLWPNVG
jgi:hypothetical protein